MPITLTITPNDEVPIDALRDRLTLAEVPFEETDGTFAIECADEPTADFWQERIGENWGAGVERAGDGDEQPVEKATRKSRAAADAEPTDAQPGEADTDVQPS